MSFFNSVLDTIGNTPLIRLNKLFCQTNIEVYVKMEASNPSGSIKVRIAANMINSAEKQGLIHEKTHIVEPTSGNTGIGLAMVCAVKGYHISLVMPESASVERRKIMKAYGAEVVLTPADEGMQGAIAQAEKMVKEDPSIFIPNQFENLSNPQIHEVSTGPEIWNALNGKIDAFVAAVGTGGTITGVGHYLKQMNPKIELIALEPLKSQVLSGFSARSHKIQGMGAGFIPPIMDLSIIDQILAISDEEAFDWTRKLAQKEGIFAGISSGAAIAGVSKHIANLQVKIKNSKNQSKYRIVTVLPDTGERYLSTDLW